MLSVNSIHSPTSPHPSTHPPIHHYPPPYTSSQPPFHCFSPKTEQVCRRMQCGRLALATNPAHGEGVLWSTLGTSAQPTLPTHLGAILSEVFSDPRLTLCPQHVLMESHCPSPPSPHMPAGWDCQLLHVRGSIALVQVSPVRRHCPSKSRELQWPHVAGPACAWRLCSLLRPHAGPRSPSKLPTGSGGLRYMEDWHSGPSLGGPSSDWVKAVTPRSSL